MTLPALVPTREQWEAARGELKSAAEHIRMAAFSSDDWAVYHRNCAWADLKDVIRALGLHVSAQPPAQQPSDLVKRLREVTLKVATLIGPKNPDVVLELGECVEKCIEALEAAAVPQGDLTKLREALKPFTDIELPNGPPIGPNDKVAPHIAWKHFVNARAAYDTPAKDERRCTCTLVGNSFDSPLDYETDKNCPIHGLAAKDERPPSGRGSEAP